MAHVSKNLWYCKIYKALTAIQSQYHPTISHHLSHHAFNWRYSVPHLWTLNSLHWTPHYNCYRLQQMSYHPGVDWAGIQTFLDDIHIDADSYKCTEDIFEYHLHEYQESTPESSASRPTPAAKPTVPNSFLANITHQSSSISLATAPDLASNFQHYALFEHGKDKAGALKNPLLWWKVRLSLSCTLSCYWYCSVGSSTQISHHRPYGLWFPCHPWCCGLHQMSLLEVLASMHGPALEFEGCDTHSSYVHQGVASGGSYEMGLRLWVDTKFVFTVINILLNFHV